MSTDFIPNRLSLFHEAISTACSQVQLQSCGGGRWVRMKRTPLSTNGTIWGTHWMPTPLKDRRGPFRLHGRRTRGAAAMAPCAADCRGARGAAADRSDATPCRAPRHTPPPGDRRRPRKSPGPLGHRRDHGCQCLLLPASRGGEQHWSDGVSSQGHRGGPTVWDGWGTSQAYTIDGPFIDATKSDKPSAMSLDLYVAGIAPVAIELPSSSAPGLS